MGKLDARNEFSVVSGTTFGAAGSACFKSAFPGAGVRLVSERFSSVLQEMCDAEGTVWSETGADGQCGQL